MYLPAAFWKAVVVVTSYLNLSPLHPSDAQKPLPVQAREGGCDRLKSSDTLIPEEPNQREFPVFRPPATVDPEFKCEYPLFEGWQPCSSAYDRSCWMKHRFGDVWDAATDYEQRFPKSGKTRDVKLVIESATHNADGLPSEDMILVNGIYPGPTIEACWGDTIKVTVVNKLKYNGTAIHWHGIRQEGSFPMDGVPGITQCPIAPDDEFTYEFEARQYGTSWYHSHYGAQYANGLLGPLIIHGPTSANWDTAVEPILVSDWFHESAFTVIHEEGPNGKSGYPSILINGKGDLNKFDKTRGIRYPKVDVGGFLPPCIIFKPVVGRTTRYLLRIINTSFSTTFTFSIDNHWLAIVSADFVPVLPNYRTHITVGIGQRYNVIVEARPVAYGSGESIPNDHNFWMRITVADCFNLAVIPPNNYNTMAMIRYDGSPAVNPRSKPWPDLTNSCDDATGLVPKVPWTVGVASNGWPYGEGFEAGFSPKSSDAKFPLAKWSLEKAPNTASSFKPLQVDYQQPIFLNLDKPESWEDRWVVIPEDYGKDDWIFLAFDQPGGSVPKARHPMHLHGHDFAIVQIEPEKQFSAENVRIQKFNPMRRDVILLPQTGFIVIAFKADNPGSWILHCHIAFHASEGFALQIMEDRTEAMKKWYVEGNPEMAKAQETCRKWNIWHDDCKNHWPGKITEDGKPDCYPACGDSCDAAIPRGNPYLFMDDSGI